MKITDLALIWLIILWPMQLVTSVQYEMLADRVREEMLINRAVHKALDDATYVMANETGVSDEIQIDREAASAQWFRSMKMLLPHQELMTVAKSTEFMVAMENDGFSIYSSQSWRMKQPYVVENRAGIVHKLTLGERYQWYDPPAHDWRDAVRNDESFVAWRNRSILQAVERELSSALGEPVRLLFPHGKQTGLLDAERGNMVDGIGLIVCYVDDTREIPVTILASSKIVSPAE